MQDRRRCREEDATTEDHTENEESGPRDKENRQTARTQETPKGGNHGESKKRQETRVPH